LLTLQRYAALNSVAAAVLPAVSMHDIMVRSIEVYLTVC
jgi:hypothetical protein